MKHHITIQRASPKLTSAPQSIFLKRCARKTLQHLNLNASEVTIRIVEVEEMRHLNKTFRNKDKPTNVLSFPAELPIALELPVTPLGDIAICAPVVAEEAVGQQKEPEAHWAHMVVHGICHLAGYDHETEVEAEIMEKLEADIMKTLGFTNPYA